MKRYNIRVHTWSESWSEEDFHELQITENKSGDWVKASDVEKLQRKIARMQQLIDIKAGRIQIEE